MSDDPSQLYLFEENEDELTLLKRELGQLRQRCDQLKKGMASRYNQLAKLCMVLQEENSFLRRRLDSIEKGSGDTPSIDKELDDLCFNIFR